MKIGIVLGRIGGVDGVALETEKWIAVFKRMGHSISVLTGELEAKLPDVSVLPELAFSHPACVRAQEEAFESHEVEEAELLERLASEARQIEQGILSWMHNEAIELLITENSTTLPCHLTMGMALREVILQTGIPAVSHDHDFHWERGRRYETQYRGIQEIIDDCFPLDLPNLRHVVINHYSQELLQREREIASLVIPNVMDFETPFGVKDHVNDLLPESLGFDKDDILLFQITRIVRRKGIETAIELVERLQNQRVKMVVTGTAQDDFGSEYMDELCQKALDLGVEDQVLFAGDRFANLRKNQHKGPSVYSLSDAYAQAHACTYFSSYEGFGNAFIEALVARRPLFVNNYKPVYWSDIGAKGFRTVQIEDNQLTDEAVSKAHEVLHCADTRRDWSEFNFELGRTHFSYAILEEKLSLLLEPCTDLS
ncbi:MAG: glycosyltransferase family 4 protein [Deltaproteobacteria bacterium]|nr:glycosyltransferase family 4 protein [Deltaproteobacteria bacterium]